ncbi:MAG: serine hydrolase [Coriobacteriia bacterium]|nr:serine hydrolase [Coriobacteriia bacterium]
MSKFVPLRVAKLACALAVALLFGACTPAGVEESSSGSAQPNTAVRMSSGVTAFVTPVYMSGSEPETSTADATPATPSFPSTAAVEAAIAWASERGGNVAFAVATSDGQIRGYNVDEPFVSASVVKAMLLVAYLRSNPEIGDAERQTLSAMIEYSDNDAATTIYAAVGDDGLRSVAEAVGMNNFDVWGSWGSAQLTAADQARFFLGIDSLLPENHRAFARELLSQIEEDQSWGIPTIARPAGWTVFFKGGWRETGLGQLVHQVARLERPGDQPISLAVMTDGDSSMAYGIETISGIAEILLGQEN